MNCGNTEEKVTDAQRNKERFVEETHELGLKVWGRNFQKDIEEDEEAYYGEGQV